MLDVEENDFVADRNNHHSQLCSAVTQDSRRGAQDGLRPGRQAGSATTTSLVTHNIEEDRSHGVLHLSVLESRFLISLQPIVLVFVAVCCPLQPHCIASSFCNCREGEIRMALHVNVPWTLRGCDVICFFRNVHVSPVWLRAHLDCLRHVVHAGKASVLASVLVEGFINISPIFASSGRAGVGEPRNGICSVRFFAQRSPAKWKCFVPLPRRAVRGRRFLTVSSGLSERSWGGDFRRPRNWFHHLGVAWSGVGLWITDA